MRSYRLTVIPTALVLCRAMLCGQDHPSVTYSEQVASILNSKCAACHHEGGPGPFPLVTYQQARQHSRQIAAVTSTRYMPPWLPREGAPRFDDALPLTKEQIRCLSEWAAAGAPEGDPRKIPPSPHFTAGWQLGPPDLTLQAALPHRVPAEGSDVFWNFVLQPNVTRTRYVRAIEIRPQNPQLAHHANVVLDRSGEARRREVSPGAGFGGMDVSFAAESFDPDSHFLFWKPGSLPYSEPKGLAWRLEPGETLVLNMHLQPSGKVEEERPSVGLYFTEDPPTQFPILVQLEADANLHIPAGDANFVVGDQFRIPIDCDLLAIYPHAHLLGEHLEALVTYPDGRKQALIDIPHWDLSWQAVYRYHEPMYLPKGSLVAMHYSYNNSAGNPRNPNHPPKLVEAGNRAADEMSHLFLQLLPRASGNQTEVVQEALMRHQLEKDPEDFSANFNLGALLLRRDGPEAGMPLLQRALRSRPNRPEALNAMGAALQQQGKSADAEAEFQRAAEADPGYFDAQYNLANALADDGDFEHAAALFRKLLVDHREEQDEVRKRLSLCLNAMSDAAAEKRDYRTAAQVFQEAVQLDRSSSASHNKLGVLYAKAGELTQAIEQFELALRLDQGNESAKHNLERAQASVAARRQ